MQVNQYHKNRHLISRWVLGITLLLSLFSFSVVANASQSPIDKQRTERLSTCGQKIKPSISFKSCIRKYYPVANYFTGKYNNISTYHHQQHTSQFRDRRLYVFESRYYSIPIILPTYPEEEHNLS